MFHVTSIKQQLTHNLFFESSINKARNKNTSANQWNTNKEKGMRLTIDNQLRRDTEHSDSSTSTFQRDYEKRMKMKDDRRLYDLLYPRLTF